VPDAQVHGLHLHFDEAGAAASPALLLLHGIGSNRRSFRRQLEGLAARYRAIALDAPCYGLSADPSQAFTLEAMADAAAGLLDGLGIPAAHVLGHSMGGVAAQLLYHRHPAKVRSLILADTNPGSGSLPEPERSARIERRIWAIETQTPRQMAEERAPALVSAAASRELIDELVGVMAEIRPTTYRAAAVAMGTTDLSELLRIIRVPTLVVVGELDTVTPPAVATALAQSIPGARLVTIHEAGHASHQERPDQFNATVCSFLDSLSTAHSPTQLEAKRT
jgi:3-oxoadipate enol-lactonase